MIHSDTYYFDIIRYNIKRLREEAGLTQQQLADKAGITMNLHRYRAGHQSAGQ